MPGAPWTRWRGSTRSSSRWRTATWLSYACSAPTSSVPAGGAAGRWRFSGGCLRARSGEQAEVHALNNLGTSEPVTGDAVAGRRMLVESLERARDAGFEEHAARAYSNLASIAVRQYRCDDATAALDAGLEYCGDRDLDAWTLYLRGFQAQLLLNRGDPVAAHAAAPATLRHPDLAPVSRVVPLAVLARIRARQGRDDWAEPLEEALAIADRTGSCSGSVRSRRRVARSRGSPEIPPAPPPRPGGPGRRPGRTTTRGISAPSRPGWTAIPRPPRHLPRQPSPRRSRSRSPGDGRRPHRPGTPWAVRTRRRSPWPAVGRSRRCAAPSTGSKRSARPPRPPGPGPCCAPAGGRRRARCGPPPGPTRRG